MVNVKKFEKKLRGKLVRTNDPEYDDARKVFNAMIDREPRYIAYCEDVGDVKAAVTFGHENNILTSIRSGGHSPAGLGVCDGGLVIDLSHLNYTHIDPTAKTVRVGGGATWGEVDHATHTFGMAVPSGIVTTTGVGGLTLGGGFGYLSRKYGLTIDNLLEVEMVLADGRYVTANNTQNQELFWAARGGGGNFGVVTSFKFKMHDVNTVYAGPMFWSLDQAEEMLQWYREYIVGAPREINGFFVFMNVPPGPPYPEHLYHQMVCGVIWCYNGPMEHAEEMFKPIRSAGEVLFDLVKPMSYPELHRMFNDLFPSGMQCYWKSDFVKEIPDKAIDLHLNHATDLPSMNSVMHLYPVNGAVQEVDRNDTAWSYRDVNWAQVMAGADPDPDPAKKQDISRWARNYWEDLHPYSAGGAYVNFLMDEGEERIKATYRDNYDRLARLKAKYDPDNFFRMNQNIKPEKS